MAQFITFFLGHIDSRNSRLRNLGATRLDHEAGHAIVTGWLAGGSVNLLSRSAEHLGYWGCYSVLDQHQPGGTRADRG
ncbi:MAG: hypothetical protein IID30_15660 [Planctomycetes bacterium]|nr:hypothetical protein [Planctomycetota bacterium]